MHPTVSSIVPALNWSIMPLLDNHHASGVVYLAWFIYFKQENHAVKSPVSIDDDESTLQPGGNESRALIKKGTQTCPHPEKHFIYSFWLILSPPQGPSATNHINPLLVALKCHYLN